MIASIWLPESDISLRDGQPLALRTRSGMPEPKGSDARTLAVRIQPDFHAQLSMVGQVDDVSLADLIMTALENHVAARREVPDFKVKV